VLRRGAAPDLVVFYSGVNDVAYNCRPKNGWAGHGRRESMHWRIGLPRVVAALLGNVLERSTDVTRALWPASYEEEYHSGRCYEDPDTARRVAEGYVNSLRMARDLVVARGATFVGVLQPIAYVGSPELSHLSLSLDSKRAKDARSTYPMLQELVANERRRGGTWLHDFSALFDGSEALYVDFCHVIAAGNRRVAERIAELPEVRALLAL
ncbi:MAG: hypothetical protein MJE66_18020, partial [Proteobacteria bacterium]|nr:hypothetical protein [Pseudomonadota bacterium]